MAQEDVFKKIVSHCKEYGFVFPSSEIYDGLAAVYDYGQNGVELKNNIKQYWWQSMVLLHENIVGLDASIFMHPTVWKASGHVDAFNDPLIDNRDSKKRYRADVLIEDHMAKYEEKIAKEIAKAKKRFGDSFDEAQFRATNPRVLENQKKHDELHARYTEAMQGPNLEMLKQIIEDEGIVCPMREFEQMEMQFFCQPGTEMKWFEYWKKVRLAWHEALGMGNENYRYHDHEKLAHYANAATDIEFKMPFGFKEVEGIHSRTDFDLSQHEKFSGRSIKYFDPEKNESYVPYDVETSIGVDRMFLSVMCHSYCEEKLENGETRVVLRLPEALAPVKCAVFPLDKKYGLPELAHEIVDELKFHFNTHYGDPKDSIGKRYRRQDAIGTPFCITVDHETPNDHKVTLRYRDTMEQERVAISDLRSIIEERVSITSVLKKLGKEIKNF